MSRREWVPTRFGYALGERVQLHRLVFNGRIMAWAVWIDGQLRGTWTTLQAAKRRAIAGGAA